MNETKRANRLCADTVKVGMKVMYFPKYNPYSPVSLPEGGIETEIITSVLPYDKEKGYRVNVRGIGDPVNVLKLFKIEDAQ